MYSVPTELTCVTPGMEAAQPLTCFSYIWLYNVWGNVIINCTIQVNKTQHKSTQLSTTQQLNTTQLNTHQDNMTKSAHSKWRYGDAKPMSLSLCNAQQRNALNTTVWRGEAHVSLSISFSVIQSLVCLQLFVWCSFVCLGVVACLCQCTQHNGMATRSRCLFLYLFLYDLVFGMAAAVCLWLLCLLRCCRFPI